MLKNFQGLTSLFHHHRLPRLPEFRLAGYRSAIVGNVIVLGLLYGVRQLGGLQQLELMVFDQMMRSRPDRGIDPRILVVGITESDIKAQKWPLSERIVAQTLAELNRHQPAAIAVDLNLQRNIPQEPGYSELIAQLRQPNVIAAMSNGSSQNDRIEPPIELPKNQVGLVDLPADPDGFMRRALLFTNRASFSIQLLNAYVRAGCPSDRPQRQDFCRNLKPSFNSQKEYELGGVVFPLLRSDSGAYQNINSGGYQILINYRGSSQALQRVTLTQVLQKEVNPDWIRGKIVLIGVSAPSLKDVFLTPYSVTDKGTVRISGVEVQAQITSQLLGVVLDGDRLFWFWAEWQEVLWMLGWAIAGIGLAWLIRKPLVLIASELFLLSLLVGTSYILYLQQGWIPVVAPALAFVLTSVTTLIDRQYQSQQQQKTIMRLLGQQTSPEIANALWQGRDRLLQDGRLPWQNVTATILFTDIRNFSTTVEGESPEQVMGWLNEYLTAMADVVQSHQGVVNKFIGDSVMAVFGVPIPRQMELEIAADARLAVASALAMRSVLVDLNQRFEQQGLPKIQMRVGIFTGAVMVGSLGGKSRVEYCVIGDSVNIASRLESCEKERQIDDCRILIAKETLDYLQDLYEVESWGALLLKGKAQTVEVYRVVRQV
ncbi:adenylate/guanylate cyclase domain-containing protein [Tumidithrix elongata RA019]|uniref:Adenylate/guanylate cyclase domain-containing protein n=1 Tax=Tumidithrix elongata BACA0141 TaxID=2716417 RepID=A0AAW9Q6R0_9CYAN|nr:adenylate/guanylate cyclase domain-containing protein [Tumidithrix elongata RA019]